MTLRASPDSKPAGLLRFAVFDEEDLSVMSAHLQDAYVHVRDTTYVTGDHRFALVGSRIDWSAMAEGRQERRTTGFSFDHVTRVRRSGFQQDDPDRCLQLLAISFSLTTAPAGAVLLTFAGGNLIKLDVACIEAEMRDLSEGWAVKDCPRHHLDEAHADR